MSLERFSHLTPQLRNLHLKKLYEMFPRVSALDLNTEDWRQVLHEHSDTIMENFMRRLESDFYHKGSEQIDTLLSFTETTDTFRLYLGALFRNGLSAGVELIHSRTPELGDHFSWFFNEETTRQGGIFYKEEAIVLERQAIQAHIGSRTKESTGDPLLAMSYRRKNPVQVIDSYTERLAEWRNQFTRYYDDTP